MMYNGCVSSQVSFFLEDISLMATHSCILNGAPACEPRELVEGPKAFVPPVVVVVVVL
jgi:hypothetical protein